MKSKKSVVQFTLEQRILHALMLRTYSLNDVGLMSGKMGVLLALANYNRLVLSDVYEDFADELMDEILSKIHKLLPLGLGNGLCGVAWGVEFLIQNGLMEGVGVEICEDIDRKIMETDPRRIVDVTLERGLEGVLHYVLAHIKGSFRQQSALPFDETYRADLFQAIQALSNQAVSEKMQELVADYIHFYERQAEPEYELSLDEFVGTYNLDERQLSSCPLGLGCGLAGVLFKGAYCKL